VTDCINNFKQDLRVLLREESSKFDSAHESYLKQLGREAFVYHDTHGLPANVVMDEVKKIYNDFKKTKMKEAVGWLKKS
jgi:hypothetical protein